tara:strand:- start:2066 stop:4423 length:2358 start_codon:yes stop_codon:yes gene_type:complete
MSGYSKSVAEEYRELATDKYGALQPLLGSRGDDDKMVAYVDDRVEACSQIKKRIIAEAWENISFMAGEQWSEWNEAFGQMQTSDADDWKVRLVYNYTRQIVNQLGARLTENRPIPLVHPASEDEEDQDKARLCEKLLYHLWRTQRMGRRHFEFVLWMLATGTGIYKVSWRLDPQLEAFEQEGSSDVEQHALNRFGLPVMQTGAPGMPVAEVLSMFEFGWDTGAKDFEHCRWMYHETEVHLDELVERYPERGAFADTNASAGKNHISMQQLRSIENANGQTSQLKDRAKLCEYYELPSKRYPKGLFIVKAADVLLFVGGLPFGFLPFVTSRHNVTPGSVTGAGVIRDLKQPQKQVNQKESQRVENADLMSKPKWLVPKGSIDSQFITDEPGEVIEYDSDLPAPRAVSPPPMSQEPANIARENVSHMFELGGLNELARGNIPSGMSGRAVGLFEELQATMLGPSSRETEDAIAAVGTMWLKMYRSMAPPARVLSIAGKRSIAEVVQFLHSDITSTDVEVVAGSSLPRNKTHRREQVLLVANSGWLGDPSDPKTQRKVLKHLEFDGLEEVYGDNTLDRKRARDENLIMMRANAEGAPFPLEVLPNDGHPDHCDEHDDFSKGEDFLMLQPEYKLAFIQHLAMHERFKKREEMGIPWFAEVLQDTLDPKELALYDPQFQEEAQAQGGPPQEGQPPQEQGPPPEMMQQGPPPEMMQQGPPPGMDRNMMLEQAMGPTPDPMMQPPQQQEMPPELMAIMQAMQQQQQMKASGLSEGMGNLQGPGVGDFDLSSQ